MTRSTRDKIIRSGVTEDWTPVASTTYGWKDQRVGKGQTSGSTTIKYEKEKSEEFWERTSVSSWSGPINLFGRVQTADADTKGQFSETLIQCASFQRGISLRLIAPAASFASWQIVRASAFFGSILNMRSQ
jgi:hypothetical protein